MRSALELRWNFSPENLFEEVFASSYEGCDITVSTGSVVALIPDAVMLAHPQIRAKLERHVEGRFLGVQIAAHALYELSGPREATFNADGVRGYGLTADPLILETRVQSADFRTNAGGKLVDTRQDKIEQKRHLSELASNLINDETLARMLRSYRAAVRDPEDELIHLYEVRDSLDGRFGDKKETLAKLGRSKSDPSWDRLGHLCNDPLLKQGRHRGSAGAALRTATEAELTEARTITSDFIESYMQFVSAQRRLIAVLKLISAKIGDSA